MRSVLACRLGKPTKRNADRVGNGMEHADRAVDASLLDLDQHSTGYAAPFGETFQGQIGRLSGPCDGMTKGR